MTLAYEYSFLFVRQSTDDVAPLETIFQAERTLVEPFLFCSMA